MTLQQTLMDANAARVEVRKVWPRATSSYTGATTAIVYDPVTDKVLGQAEEMEFVVEFAWVAAAKALRESA